MCGSAEAKIVHFAAVSDREGMGVSHSSLDAQRKEGYDFCHCNSRERRGESRRKEKLKGIPEIQNSKGNSFTLVPSSSGSDPIALSPRGDESSDYYQDERKQYFHSYALNHSHVKVSPRFAWRVHPDPLPGWTSEEQGKIIQILEENPKASKDRREFGQLFVKSRVLLPNKSLEDFRKCLTHVQSSRVAYFGGK